MAFNPNAFGESLAILRTIEADASPLKDSTLLMDDPETRERWLRNGYVPYRGDIVRHGEKAILLVGPMNVGKTTTAQGIASRKGASVSGNNASTELGLLVVEAYGTTHRIPRATAYPLADCRVGLRIPINHIILMNRVSKEMQEEVLFELAAFYSAAEYLTLRALLADENRLGGDEYVNRVAGHLQLLHHIYNENKTAKGTRCSIAYNVEGKPELAMEALEKLL
ncbi:MAG: hypothetical protein ABIA93_03435 [Candidatus Woesearchaeota archaeon]